MKNLLAFIGFCVMLKWVCIGLAHAAEQTEKKGNNGYARY